MQNTVDVAVVGAGVAGLCAAVEAANNGAKVVCLERAEAVGGRAQSKTIKGFTFNRGPHALYALGAFHKALSDFGVAFTAAAPDLSAGKGLWGKALHPLPTDAGSILGLTPLSLTERASLALFFQKFGGGGVAAEPGECLADLFTRLRLAPRQRALVQALIRLSTYCDAPAEQDAGAALEALGLAFGGVTYVDGGWRVLAEGLCAMAQARGVEVVTGAAGEALVKADGAIKVRTANAVWTARAAVLAAPPQTAADLAPWDKDLRAAADRSVPLRMTCLDLGLADTAPKNTFVLGVDSPVYWSVHSAVAALAPASGATVQVARYLAPGESVSPDAVAQLEALADLVQPGWRAAEAARQTLLEMVVAYDFPRAARGGAKGRAQVQRTAEDRLFLAGDWVGVEGQLSDAAAASGRLAGRLAAMRARA